MLILEFFGFMIHLLQHFSKKKDGQMIKVFGQFYQDLL